MAPRDETKAEASGLLQLRDETKEEKWLECSRQSTKVKSAQREDCPEICRGPLSYLKMRTDHVYGETIQNWASSVSTNESEKPHNLQD